VINPARFRLGIFQSRPIRGDVAGNRARAEDMLLSAPHADLWLLPELAFTGYQFADCADLSRHAEEVPGATSRWAQGLAKKLDSYIAYGFPLKLGGKIFNAAVIVGKNGVMGIYQKTHLFFREKDYFDSGETGFQVWDMGGAKIGMMICFDWIFPESARTLALMGADLILHPANLVLHYSQRAMYARAVENGVFTATVNRVGEEALGDCTLCFQGGSIVYSPRGRTVRRLNRGTQAREELAVVTLDLTRARDKLFTPSNHLFRDRRPSLYRLD
jgi:predicted amidohydrolase